MATNRSPTVKLSRPVDFDILQTLDEHGRNVARNLQHQMDASRAHINNRLPYLADYSLVRKIGPDPNSGLYEITETGRVALKNRDQYDDVEDFEALVEDELDQLEE